ncbi:hypothetical protein BGZ94_005917 [Podila epigama]|nr:hypothetical protein BGZ94_005917 [Podila epigama]
MQDVPAPESRSASDSQTLIPLASTPLLVTSNLDDSTVEESLDTHGSTIASSAIANSNGKRPSDDATASYSRVNKSKRLIVEETDEDSGNHTSSLDTPSQHTELDNNPVDEVQLTMTPRALDALKTSWMVKQLNKASVFTILQRRNQGTPRKTPKSKKAMDQKRMKNKIESMQACFKRADALTKKSGFGRKGSESWKKKIREACSYYFDLEANWSMTWPNDWNFQYCDSTCNMDDDFVDDDVDEDYQEEDDAWESDEGDDAWLFQEEEDEEAAENDNPSPVRPSLSQKSNTTNTTINSRVASTLQSSQKKASTPSSLTLTSQGKGKGKAAPAASNHTPNADQDRVYMYNLLETIQLYLTQKNALAAIELAFMQEQLEADIRRNDMEMDMQNRMLDLQERRLEMEHERFMLEMRRYEDQQKRRNN